MIRGLHHTSFTVSDVEATELFFVEHLGMKRLGGGLYDFDYIRRTVGYPDAVLKISILGSENPEDSHRLELIEYVTPRGEAVDTATNRAGAAHLAFVVDDIEAEYERLRTAGIRFKSSPNEVTFGINRGAKAVYFNGPDGIALELLQPAKRS
jgi:catechol 2,3-dioxygenase-like lactoylglutathione lyase family enzyme